VSLKLTTTTTLCLLTLEFCDGIFYDPFGSRKEWLPEHVRWSSNPCNDYETGN